MSARYELIKAVIAELKGNAPLTSLIATYGGFPAVFTHVPQDMIETYPYIVMYDAPLNTDDTDSSRRFEGVFNIHSWSDQRDVGIIANIQGAIYDCLHQVDFTMTGYGLVELHQEFENVLRDPDGITLHGVQRFRVIIETL